MVVQASLLIEHLNGLTFEQLILQGTDLQLKESMAALWNTLESIWVETRKKKSVPANFIGQTRKRLTDVYSIHPSFKASPSRIGHLDIISIDELLIQAEKIEKSLKSPFSVYIHGDFNVDNVIYDPEVKKINFIDLHRSNYNDYIQDVSVFMVSNYRLQMLDSKTRNRIRQQILQFYKCAKRFSKKT